MRIILTSTLALATAFAFVGCKKKVLSKKQGVTAEQGTAGFESGSGGSGLAHSDPNQNPVHMPGCAFGTLTQMKGGSYAANTNTYAQLWACLVTPVNNTVTYNPGGTSSAYGASYTFHNVNFNSNAALVGLKDLTRYDSQDWHVGRKAIEYARTTLHPGAGWSTWRDSYGALPSPYSHQQNDGVGAGFSIYKISGSGISGQVEFGRANCWTCHYGMKQYQVYAGGWNNWTNHYKSGEKAELFYNLKNDPSKGVRDLCDDSGETNATILDECEEAGIHARQIEAEAKADSRYHPSKTFANEYGSRFAKTRGLGNWTAAVMANYSLLEEKGTVTSGNVVQNLIDLMRPALYEYRDSSSVFYQMFEDDAYRTSKGLATEKLSPTKGRNQWEYGYSDIHSRFMWDACGMASSVQESINEVAGLDTSNGSYATVIRNIANQAISDTNNTSNNSIQFPAFCGFYWTSAGMLASALNTATYGNRTRQGMVSKAAVSIGQQRAFSAYKSPDNPNALASNNSGVSSGYTTYQQKCAECHGSIAKVTTGGTVKWAVRKVAIPENAGGNASSLKLQTAVYNVGTDSVYSKEIIAYRPAFDNYIASLYDYSNDLMFMAQNSAINAAGEYPAPVLVGAWTSGFYFHNGCAPSLEHVLKSSLRSGSKTFKYSSNLHDYDAVKVGLKLVSSQSDATLIYDTTKYGANCNGHTYGDSLSSSARANLISFLEQLTGGNIYNSHDADDTDYLFYRDYFDSAYPGVCDEVLGANWYDPSGGSCSGTATSFTNTTSPWGQGGTSSGGSY